MKYIIYKFTNLVNGKEYVGLTIQPLEKRVYLHWWAANHGSGMKFHNALRKYPIECWNVIPIEEGDENKDHILERERYFVEYYNTFINGYNATRGGDDFTDSEFQRNNQLTRVARGEHPFIGGTIQRNTGIRRWKDGTHNFIGLNQQRISNGTHNLLGDMNPQTRRKREGGIHHNQQKPWCNTKTTIESIAAWRRADELYNWWKDNHTKSRCGPYKMAKEFNITTSLQVMWYKYFNNGWIPNEDSEWIRFNHDP